MTRAKKINVVCVKCRERDNNMRNEINGQDLELITGGKLKYDNGNIWDKSDPGTVYHYDDIQAVADYLKAHWTYSGTYDSRALDMLLDAGLIW